MNHETPKFYPAFSTLLTQYLQQYDRSQAWLAKRLGVHHGTVSRWLTQGTRPKSPEMVIQIADILGIYNLEERQRLLVEAGYGIAGANNDGAKLSQHAEGYSPKQKNAAPDAESPPDMVDTYWQAKIDGRLGPRTHTRLFGIKDNAERLTQLLLEPDDIWLIGIHGMGGLGKTTLVDYVVRQPKIGQRFADVAWVDIKHYEFLAEEGTVREDHPVLDIDGIVESLCAQLDVHDYQALPPQQKYKTLLNHLSETPCLFVLDNFEHSVDKQKTVPFLHTLVNPSKVVITSRYNLSNDSSSGQIDISGLSENDAIAFLYHLVGRSGATVQSSTIDEQLGEIYEQVGGNPLALRLISSQIRMLSLPVVLQNLATTPDDEIDTFYGYIYRQSWELLKPEAQKLLGMMPLVDNGTNEQLAVISGLEQRELHTALRQLVRMSLVEVRGDLEEKCYFVYRLTETFLLKEYLEWKSGDSLESQLGLGSERNLGYWLGWLDQNGSDVTQLDLEWAGIVKAIRYGLRLPPVLSKCYTLIERFSPYMERRGHWKSWSQMLENAIRTAKETAESSRLPSLSLLRARLLKHQSHYREAVSEYQRTIRLARQIGDHFTKARAWSNLGHLYIELDRWWRAEILCIYALQIFEEADSNHGRAHTHNHLGILYTRQCRWKKAWFHLEKALALWQEMDDRYGLLLANLNLGKLATDMRMEGLTPSSPAYDYLEVAIQYGEETADDVTVGIAQMNMGAVCRLDGRIDEAERLFLASEAIFERYGDALGIALITDNLGVIHADQGKLEQAVEYFQQSLGKWRELGNHHGELRALLYLADWEYQIGSKKNSRQWLAEAGSCLTKYGKGQKYRTLQAKFDRISSSLSS